MAELGVFGKGASAGRISFCEICHNKAECSTIPEDGRLACGDCTKTYLTGMTHRGVGVEPIPEPGKVIAPAIAIPVTVNGTDEKSKYLDVIRNNATPAFVDKAVREIVKKGILHYDFARIIENDRWFSVMDLRAMALLADPDFEQQKLKPELPPIVYAEDSGVKQAEEEPKPKKRNKRRKKC